MAEEEPAEPALEADDTETHDPARARAALEKKNREAKALRDRLRELEPLAAKAREADEAAKTELQKAAEARATAERERDEARLALARRDAADEAGLPKAWADRLRGSTTEELLADAKNLAKEVGPKDVPPPRSAGRPVADLRPGALPAGDGATASGFNADDWLRKQAGK